MYFYSYYLQIAICIEVKKEIFKDKGQHLIKLLKQREAVSEEVLSHSWKLIVKKAHARRKRMRLYYIGSAAASIIILISAGYFFKMDLNRMNHFKSELPVFVDSISYHLNDIILFGKNSIDTLQNETHLRYADLKEEVESTSSIDDNNEKNKQDNYNHLIVPYGKRVRVTLSDGTEMYVNSGSQVIYPLEFEKDTRHIQVKGEVFLKVTPNKKKPFIVSSGDFKTTVLGTSFNLSIDKNGLFEVVLINGSVEVDNELSQTKYILSPNEKYEFNNDVISVSYVDVESYISWVDYIMFLDNKCLSNVLSELSNHYGIDIECDPVLSNLKTGGKLDLKEGLDYALQMLVASLNLEYVKKDNKYHIYKK